jgi:hypothetical protein
MNKPCVTKIVLMVGLSLAFSTSAQHKDVSPEKLAERARKALENSGGLSGARQLAPEQGAAVPENTIPVSNNPLGTTKLEPPVTFLKPRLQTAQGQEARNQTLLSQGVKDLNAAMKIETERFDRLLGQRFSVSLLNTEDGLVRQFIANGVLKMNPDIYTRMESGLASIYVANGKINGQARPVCYVLNNPARAGHLWRSFVPEDDKGEKAVQWAASYLVAHEVGHCLDRLQREAYTQKGQWNAEQLQGIGIPVAAFNRTFGAGRTITAKEYSDQQVVLNRDGGLMQYQERVADAFAVLWMMANKSPNEHLKPIWDTRNRVASHGVHHAHATTPTLQKAYALGMEIKTMPNMDTLWGLARQAQIQGGIDATLEGNSKLVHADAEGREAAPNTKPGEISKNGTLPAVVRFDRLPKFGN